MPIEIELQIERLQELCEQASAGPWTYSDGFHEQGSPSALIVRPDRRHLIDLGPADEDNNRDDAVFIAYARTALPALQKALIDAHQHLERLRKIEEEARRFCEHVEQEDKEGGPTYEAFKTLLGN